MTISEEFRTAHEDVSLNISRAHGLVNALYFVIQGSDELMSDTDSSRAVTSLVAMLEDVITAAHDLHSRSWQLAGGK
ncbi:hypothetical protein [Szabonella alba]|uniref:Uncharacterized protein n=1 Tax=Szabonella alba TaxID=2804194 RepID=A0A8K0Y1D2_9RHOB|nr:hypothetical protein [Szabonella alba]MBL4917762.1 hypothetical protein [Szabonella alba]